jgi:hypothetical protein
MPRSARRRSSAKQALRDGRIPEDWKDKPAKLAQKDCDARWTIKYTKAKPKEDGVPQVDLAIPAFGYKNHIAIDRAHGLIRQMDSDACRRSRRRATGGRSRPRQYLVSHRLQVIIRKMPGRSLPADRFHDSSRNSAGMVSAPRGTIVRLANAFARSS